MNLLVLSRMCLKCMKTVEAISEHCPQCGEPLVSCVAKLLSVNDKPVTENPEISEPGEVSWPLESVRAKVESELLEGSGRKTCTCGQLLRAEDLQMYPHEGGTLVEGMGKQWLYLHCVGCCYDWALWKLRISFEDSWTVRTTIVPLKEITEPLWKSYPVSAPSPTKPF